VRGWSLTLASATCRLAMALVHAGLGKREAVFEWLAEAHYVRDVHKSIAR